MFDKPEKKFQKTKDQNIMNKQLVESHKTRMFQKW